MTSSTTPPKNAHGHEAGGRRTESLRLNQRKIISRMLTIGHTQSEIAEHLGISESTVSREVARLKDSFKQQVRGNIGELQMQELAKLDEVETSAWVAHQRSGSMDSLNTILRAIKTRASLLGLDNPDIRFVVERSLKMQSVIINVLSDELTNSGQLGRIIERLREAAEEFDCGLDYKRATATRIEELSSPPDLPNMASGNDKTQVPARRFAVRRKAK